MSLIGSHHDLRPRAARMDARMDAPVNGGHGGAGGGEAGGRAGSGGGGGDAVGGWLRGRASLPAQGAAAALLVVGVWEIARRAGNGVDNRVLVRAARVLLDGGSPYADKRLLYLPSSVPLAVPEAVLGDRVLQVVVPVASALLILAGWWAALRIF